MGRRKSKVCAPRERNTTEVFRTEVDFEQVLYRLALHAQSLFTAAACLGAERALKKAILNRKNCLFYKTLKGAEVGDLYMSLIHTCELNGGDPVSYLTELLRHADELVLKPADWMPWNFQATLEQLQSKPA